MFFSGVVRDITDLTIVITGKIRLDYLPKTLLELLGPDIFCAHLMLQHTEEQSSEQSHQVGDSLLARGWVPSVLVLATPGVDDVFGKSLTARVDKSTFPPTFTTMLQSVFSRLSQKRVY